MAGLFSKKNKKDRDDSSSTNNSANARYQGRASSSGGNRENGDSNFRDNSSSNNSVSYGNSDYSRGHSPNPQQQQQQQQQQYQQYGSGSNTNLNAPSIYSSKTSLLQLSQQHLQYQGGNNNINSTTFTTNGGPWSSGVVMSTNPFPRFAHTASYVTTGTDIYVFGGIVKGSAQKDVFVIDPQSLHCQQLPVGGNTPPAMSGHSAVALGQYIIYFGGKDPKGKPTDALYVLHTGRKEWNKPLIQTLLPAPRHSHAACVIGTVMYIIGGQFSGYYMNDIAAFDLKSWADDKFYYNDIWCYDPQTNKWEAIPAYGTLPMGRQGHTTTVINDTMYIHGGMNFEDQLLGDVCAFRFNERRWTAFPSMIEAALSRTEHAMCNIGDKIYILGGQLDLNTNEDMGMIYVLDTAMIRWGEFSIADGSQRSGYDNESLVRAEGQGHDDRNSPYNQLTPTPDSARYNQSGFDQTIHPHDLRRRTHQPQHQIYQPPLSQHQDYQDHQEQSSGFHQQHQSSQQPQPQQQRHMHSESGEASGSRTGLGIMNSSGHELTPSPLPSSSYRSDDDMEETTHVARRRTIGKPTGFNIHDLEPRRAVSAEEHRHVVQDHDSTDDNYNSQDQARAGPIARQHSTSQLGHNYTEPENRGYPLQQLQQQQQRGDRLSQFNKGNNNSGSSRSLHHHLSDLDLSRQRSIGVGSTAAVTDTLQRHGSTADGLNHNESAVEDLNRESYTSITDLQTASRSSVDPSLRIPLRVTNPDHEGRDLYYRNGGPEIAQEISARHDASNSEVSKEATDLKNYKQREQWLLAEVSMARKKMGERPLSMAILALEDQLEACEVDSEKYRIMQALLNVKAELERSKTTIATQAQIASNKIREAERIRTSALQEAVYLKAKVNALQSGEVSVLVATETARATDLERRLTSALAQLEQYESQFVQYETILDHEKESRLAAEDREQEASSRAEESQLAHTRALNELSMLHERATLAEATLRETVSKSATNEAGVSSYQQQSAALYSQISALKTTVDHQKKSLDKTKMAYTVANERAENADKLWTQSRVEMDQLQLELSSVRADHDRAHREADHWRTKANETELLWQKAKKENETMRALLEEDMNASFSDPVSKDRSKHDSFIAITSASRVAELEHELVTLQNLLKDSQDAATQANRDLSDTMIRISQLEQSSIAARAEAATAQRQLTEARDKVSHLQAKLISKEETVDEMIQEQENNEVQLGLLRGVMKEHGIIADDLILEALSGADGKTPSAVSPLKIKIQEAERRAAEAENQLQDFIQIKRSQAERIEQLEADYQTAVHYIQGVESTLQKLRDEALISKNERESLRANLEEMESTYAKFSSRRGRSNGNSVNESTAELEEELADMHRQLHAAHERNQNLDNQIESLSVQLQTSESHAEVSLIELQSLKNKHQEQKKRGANQTDQLQTRVEQLEQSLAEMRHQLDRTLEDLDQAHELNKFTGQELEDALDALKKNQDDRNRRSPNKLMHAGRQEEFETAIDNAQRTIQSLQQANYRLEKQLQESENKISLLLDNIQTTPDSVRSSIVSMSGVQSPSMPSSPTAMMAAAGIRSHLNSPPITTSARSMSPASPSTKPTRRSLSASPGHGARPSEVARSLTDSQKLEEYEKLIDEMTNARRQYDE
ncbi:Negative regulator of mitotic exit [Dissophora globulifera]|nr:Negative regulator of mitotic exit [Dissophora globulifera]